MKDFPVVPDPPQADSGAEPISESVTDLVSDPLKTLEIKPQVLEALSGVYDPEIPVNIFELGLIYDIIVDKSATVGVKMTLTAPACPAAQTLPVEVREKIRRIPGVAEARVEIVWDPPWSKERMSDAAKLQLGLW
jgi:FeS assembly SUF system protein